MIALGIEAVGHSFRGRRVLDSVSFTVEEGRFAVLLGRNGAGKTTLFSLITGLYHAREGRVSILGDGVREAPVRALSRIGIVFQQPTLDLDLTVRENLRYHAALHGLPSAEAAARMGEELTRLGVLDRERDLARDLSGGQRRRVEIARALMPRPSLLLLDEPTSGLDVPSRRALAEHVRRLCRDRGIAVLWATHILEEAGEDDQLIVLHEGAVRWQGQARDIAPGLGVTGLPAAFAALTGSA